MEKIYNLTNMKDSEIEEVVTRVKALLMDKSRNVIFASSGGGIQLTGGHVEEGETNEQGLVREVMEETGIALNPSKIQKPFFRVAHYTRNHKVSHKNRLSQIYYYYVPINEAPNLSRAHLTEHEKENNFCLRTLPYAEFVQELKVVRETAPQDFNRVIADELLQALASLDLPEVQND